MNKNTKLEERMKEDQIASIGIGAMIVFIALILVAAVASAVIIQTGEKLQQNAQQTGSDTQEEIGGKINIITIWVGDQNDCDGDEAGGGNGQTDLCITLVFELAAGSEQMSEDQIHWSITCLDNASSGMEKIWGTFDGDVNNGAGVSLFGDGTTDADLMNLDTTHVDGSVKCVDNNDDGDCNDVGELQDDDVLNPGQVYMIHLKTSPDLDAATPDQSTQNQGECNPVLNEQHTLAINVEGGGTTTEILSYTSVDEGAAVV